MKVKINLPLPWQKFASNTKTIEVDGSTVGECLKDMFQKFTALQGAVPPTGFEIHINGEKVFSWQSDRPVKDGDELIISSISGCCCRIVRIMKSKTMFIAALSAISILLMLWLTLAVSCQTTEAPETVNEGAATSELNLDLLGTQHTYFLHGEGRLAGNVVLESPDVKVTLSMISGTALLDKDGRPLTFLQLQADPNPPSPPVDAQIIGTVYDLTPHGATSNPPLMLTLPYRPEDLPEDVQEKDLYIVPYDEENGWGAFYYRKVDTENHRVTAQVNAFSNYAILASKELPPPPSLTMASLKEALSNGRPTVAEFGSSKCVPCKMMKPVLENLAIIFEGELNVVIIEVYEQMSLAREYKIMSIPTQIIFDENGQEITQHIGYWPMEDILAELEQAGVK